LVFEFCIFTFLSYVLNVIFQLIFFLHIIGSNILFGALNDDT
jgi:hypothetical protein